LGERRVRRALWLAPNSRQASHLLHVIPALAPFSFILAALAFHVERKHKVRLFIGNRGWLYLAMPSDNAVPPAREEAARKEKAG
jgi:hypothetical protein